jgi:hypothetical protein
MRWLEGAAAPGRIMVMERNAAARNTAARRPGVWRPSPAVSRPQPARAGSCSAVRPVRSRRPVSSIAPLAGRISLSLETGRRSRRHSGALTRARSPWGCGATPRARPPVFRCGYRRVREAIADSPGPFSERLSPCSRGNRRFAGSFFGAAITVFERQSPIRRVLFRSGYHRVREAIADSPGLLSVRLSPCSRGIPV